MSIEIFKLNRVEINGLRHYETPIGVVPSVTTILDVTKAEESKKNLQAWRDRVGEEEAEKIRQTSADNGSEVHSIIERHYNGEPFEINDTIRPLWHSIYPQICRATNPLGLEATVWHPLGYAGSVDFIGYFDGRLVILDWKTKLKPAWEKWIGDYFCQVAAYIAGSIHLYKLPIEGGAVIVANPKKKAQVFWMNKACIRQYWKEFVARKKRFDLLVAQN